MVTDYEYNIPTDCQLMRDTFLAGTANRTSKFYIITEDEFMNSPYSII